MNKKLLILGIALIFISIVLSGCTQTETHKNGDVRLVSTEYIGGPNNLSILHLQNYYEGEWSDMTEINYTKDGVEHQGAYWSGMNDNLNWIKANTSENCTILCWWDYGMMIEGYAERNVIARFGSLSCTDFIGVFGILDDEAKENYIKNHEWTSNDTIEDIANMLTSMNFSSNETQEIIDRYNVSYIYTCGYDKFINYIFLNIAGKNPDDYYIDNQPTDLCNETLIFKMWEENPQVEGLELCYSNNESDLHSNVRIFKVI